MSKVKMRPRFRHDREPGSLQPRSRLGHGASRIHAGGDRKRTRTSDHAGSEAVHAAVAVSCEKRELKIIVSPKNGGGREYWDASSMATVKGKDAPPST